MPPSPDSFVMRDGGEFVTFCDMIFPWFLFIVGVAIPFSVRSFRKRHAGLPLYLGKVAKRSILLIFLGVLIDSSIQKRIAIGMNVLQLIGLAYFFGALLYELPRRWRLGTAALLLIAHWILLRFIPFPGGEAGVFEEGKTIVDAANRALRPYHLAGILSAIPTAALVLIGTHFGDMFLEPETSGSRRLKILFSGGAILTVLGLLGHLDIPMSKHLWTASYILFSAGLGSIVLGLFYYVIDLKGYRKIAFPAIVYGTNAITAYFISIMVRVHTVQEWTTTNAAGEKITLWRALLDFWTGLGGTYIGSYLFTGSYITFWFFVLLWMYRRKLFLRV